ncbi:multifunctional tryptophan biosynthesis protein [Cryptococcus floricola]|uniref:Multifunctional tryptophan biosynthesis protein n=1 Tax=Cryptococcus floricola TaxID=2591691 RepID=A0A5D3AQU2_9TREE|nr:multifunctional tryptophan biosynthesis protein [Cryptococcus floricola]
MGFTLLIDNYDSFTWNIYADIAAIGGNPYVVRNDKITLQEIQKLYETDQIARIVISPGPGHPRTDSGVSRDVIQWGMGKLPIMGVCMGLECLVDCLGGDIGYAGEIMHGKSSLVTHDSLGCFHDLPQDLSSIRYHSLAASISTIPQCLQVTAASKESGVIMGVRHRVYTVEAVQYHPESCLSEGGKGLMANFLKLKGGKWGGENAWCGVVPEGEASTEPAEPKKVASSNGTGAPSLPTILNKIHSQRLQDIDQAKTVLSTTPDNVSKSIALHTAPPLISFYDRVKNTPHTAIMAEIKRASPSKGDIAPDASAPEQGLKYALAGASVISVLTEPKWFKGSLIDMLAVRNAVSTLPNRPAILRKDFVLSTYMIDEARLYGADTVLLIVAMLDPDLLSTLYNYSVSLGMEPLVEVNNPKELELALQIGAKVIGVNNRNLHDFNVDMSTTTRVNAALKGRGDVILCALSGISQPEDVETYVKEGVKAVLVGESLMRAKDTGAFLRSLIGLPEPAQKQVREQPLVKICGIRSAKEAQLAIDAGADLLGIILVPGTKRCISLETAREIAQVVRTARASRPLPSSPPSIPSSPEPWFRHNLTTLSSRPKPLLVGVFQNEPLASVIHQTTAIELDLVQLHGDEPQQWAQFIPVPVIKVFRVDDEGKVRGGEVARPGQNSFILLDKGTAQGGGGEGLSFPWKVAKSLISAGEANSLAHPLPVILAGGLTPENVGTAIEETGDGVWCVDVSSGVEGEGGKDEAKVRAFVKAVKG